MWDRQGRLCADLLPTVCISFPWEGSHAETRDPDMLNIKAAGLKRVCVVLFTGRGGGKGGGWVTNCLQSQ